MEASNHKSTVERVVSAACNSVLYGMGEINIMRKTEPFTSKPFKTCASFKCRENMEHVAVRFSSSVTSISNFLGVCSYGPQNSHRVIAAPEPVMELLAGILPLAPLPVDISIQQRYFIVCGTIKEAPGDNAATSQRALMPWKEHVMNHNKSRQSNSDSQKSGQLQLGSPREAFALPPAKGQCEVSDV